MRRTTTLSQDERAIEGLPIRLVIALVVGVASLGIMMTMLDGMVLNTQKEVTLEITSDTISGTGSSVSTIDVKVITEDGDPVPGAQVLITSGTLTLENNPHTMGSAMSSATTETGENGKLSANPPCKSSGTGCGPITDFRADQDKGTLKFDIVLRGSGNYKDEKSNPELVVTQ